MKLLHNDGAPTGISFRRHKQNPKSYVIRVSGNGEQTDIGADADTMHECFKRAVERRLAFLGMSDNAEAFDALYGAFDAFLTRYGIVIQPVVKYEFKFSNERK